MNKSPLESGLDYTYRVFVFEQINGADINIKRKWVTYNTILTELNKMGETELINEIKYRITDNENDKIVFKTSLNKIKNKNETLNLLLNSI
jgi:hypothetical protein